MTPPPRRIAIVGAGISGLGAAYALSREPERFDFRVYEANDRLGGNAVTVDMPQADGSSIPFDISVTACIPTVYQNYLQLLDRLGVELVETRFSYSVDYAGDVYAHDFDSGPAPAPATRDRPVPAPASAPAPVRGPEPRAFAFPKRP